MRLFRQLFAVLALLCATYAHAEVVAGKDYKLLNPPQPSSGAKIEVVEFFFYACPHCWHMYAPLAAWEKSKAKDVELKFVPVMFNEAAEPMARTYYVLEAMGKLGTMHEALFKAWHVDNIDLSDEAKIADFVAKHGVDRQRFEADYNSFAIASKIARSNQMAQSYNIRGTPTIIVDGKYVITGLTPQDTIRVLDEVVKVARKERAGR